MTLPPLASGAGRGGRRLLVGTLLVLLVATGSPRLAAADDDPFSTTVTVDATSDNAAKARELARIDGQRRALNAIVDRLAGGAGKAKLPKLNDSQITDLVVSFEVANEKMSAVRYIADYTFHFRADALRKTLQTAGIAIVEPGTTEASGTPNAGDAGAKPVVVLPVYQTGTQAVLWEDPNPWRQAWAQRAAGAGSAKLLVPMGDVGDVRAIDAETARTGDAAALGAIAGKYAADEVLLVLAVQRAANGEKPGGLDVTVRRYKSGRSVDVHSDSVDANPAEGSDALCARAAAQIAADIDTGWKNVKELRVDQQGSIVATLAINGLDDWIKLRSRVAASPAVRKLDIRSLSRQEATIEIQYVGSLDALKASLAGNRLNLEGGDPMWRIARSDGDRP